MFDTVGPWEARNRRADALRRARVTRVWIDLAVLYPRDPTRPRISVPDGVDLQSRVPGELLGWQTETRGGWVGWVCVPISRGEEIRYVYQYVPAHALTPREDAPARRDDPDDTGCGSGSGRGPRGRG